MSKFANGLMAGGILGAIGVGVAMNDRRAKKKMIKVGKQMLNKTENMMDHLADNVEGKIDSMM